MHQISEKSIFERDCFGIEAFRELCRHCILHSSFDTEYSRFGTSRDLWKAGREWWPQPSHSKYNESHEISSFRRKNGRENFWGDFQEWDVAHLAQLSRNVEIHIEQLKIRVLEINLFRNFKVKLQIKFFSDLHRLSTSREPYAGNRTCKGSFWISKFYFI